MKNGREKGRKVRHPARCRQDGRDLERVVDIGRGLDVLPPLSPMLVCSELQSLEELRQLGDMASRFSRVLWITRVLMRPATPATAAPSQRPYAGPPPVRAISCWNSSNPVQEFGGQTDVGLHVPSPSECPAMH